jgi:CubicO group peptidase (beta-lactamase class C family)
MRELDALMRDYDGAVPGASVLVVRDGRAVVKRAYGFANLEEQIPATPATNYRLASVTKQFTAAAVLSLNIDLDRPVFGAITIRHLLTHTSGVMDYEDLIPAGTTEQLRDADALRLLESQDRVYFAPGTNYRYSNSGYALLALLVERESGMEFGAFLRETIFKPLGMDNTGVSDVANRAYGYTGLQRTDQSLTSAVLGDGGVYSSIDDLEKWDAALYDDRFAEIFVPRTKTDDPDTQYGYGWRITGDSVWHSGESIGFRNVIVRYPKRRLTVVILTNRNEPEPYPMALQIAEMFS